MEFQNEKCVMVLDERLPLGFVANTAGILGITLGKEMPEIVGEDVEDEAGKLHLGIIEFPVPILRADAAKIKELRERLYGDDLADVTVVDFSDLAQSCKTYAEFIEKMQRTKEDALQYFGIALCGSKKKINKLTGNLPLLR